MIKKLLTNPLVPAYFIAIIIFYFSYGFNVLNPTNVNWLMSARSDLGQHYLGWAYFRGEAWTFPLGTIKNYAYPIGTNIGFTDSIPLLALLFKPFSAVLPNEFQYFGLWLLFCYIMIAHYTLKIVSLYAVKLPYALAIVAIVVANPALWFRGVHPALCVHGFILAGIYLYLKPSTKHNSAAINWHQVILLAFSAVIHPYITVIIIGFNFIIPIKHYVYDKTTTLGRAAMYPVVAIVATVALWFIVGLIDFNGGQSYAARVAFETPFNANSLFNSWGNSSFFPALSRGSNANFESYMYLGLGMFIIILIALVGLFASPQRLKKIISHKNLLPLFILLVLMAVFSLSNKAMMGDTVLYDIPLPDALLYVGKVFRASARFFWPAYYIIMIFFCVVLVKSRVLGKATLVLLLLLVALQAYDLKKLFINRNFPSGTFDTPFDDDNWVNATRDFDKIIIYRPFVVHNVSFGDWQDLLYLALKNHKPISTGNTARDNSTKSLEYTNSLTHAIENNRLSKKSLYVTPPADLEIFSMQLYNKELIADYLDGFYLLHAPGKIISIKNPTKEALHKKDSVNNKYAQKLPLKEFIAKPGKEVHFNLEAFSVTGSVIRTRGWAFAKNSANNTGDSIFMTIKKGSKTYYAPLTLMKRPDLNVAFKNKTLENSGFIGTVHTDFTEKDSIGIAVKTHKGEWAYTPFIKSIVKDKLFEPVAITKLPPHSVLQEGGIDEFKVTGDEIFVTGWSVLKTSNAIDQNVKVVLTSRKKTYAIEGTMVLRPDVTQFLKGYNYNQSGFKVIITTTSLNAGTYRVGVLVKEKATGKQSVFITDKEVVVQ